MILGIDHATRLGPAEGVLATDLLCGADELATQLRWALREGQWLDAYLLAAGLGQLVEDRLHADPLLLNRAASYLRSLPSRPARLAGTASAAAGAVLRVRPAPGRQRLVRARHATGGLAGLLAAQVLGPEPAGPLAEDPAPLLDAIEDVRPALAGDVPRIPTCFHSFDQHPDDVRWLVRAFRLRYPGRGRPLCVVGVRTSGSYLAPLHAAALRAAGHDPVQVLTYRPGSPFLRWERSVLETTARAGGLVLVVDDPPGTGSAIAQAARAVAAAGVPDPAIILLLPLFGSSDEPPELLRRWQAVVQPWADWSVHSRLAAQPVAETLATLLPPGIRFCEVEQLDPPWPARDRGHARAMFMARLLDGHSGESVYRRIMVEGAGLGYLGRQGVAVASAIPGQVPHVYGFTNGLIYRDWLPPGGYPDAGDELAETVAGYVNARRGPAGAIGRGGPHGWPRPRLGGGRPAAVPAVRGAHGAGPAAAVRPARAAAAPPRSADGARRQDRPPALARRSGGGRRTPEGRLLPARLRPPRPGLLRPGLRSGRGRGRPAFAGIRGAAAGGLRARERPAGRR